MAVLDDLINQIEDKKLRDRIRYEVARVTKQRKFGLVFENHIPECTPLYGTEIKKGRTVALKNGELNDLYNVVSIDGDNVLCQNRKSGETRLMSANDIVAVAKFGDPIYPYLQKIDSVENAPDSDLWHTLIEADNYHALQLLEYLYAGKVDCIYIDPPYNTGARDWKYNNNYVDSNDAYRHSKWLSFMEKRLKLAKKLLNPKDSVLIVTIDEKEYLHLGMLLEQMFPEARIQMISSVINPKGTARKNEFSRVNEFIYFVMIGNCEICKTGSDMLTKDISNDTNVRWRGFLRNGKKGIRSANPGSWYPIYFNVSDDTFNSVGDTVYENDPVPKAPDGTYAVWPPVRHGQEYSWAMVPSTFRELYRIGAIKFGKPGKGKGCSISYLTSNQLQAIKDGKIIVAGHDNNGSMIVKYSDTSKTTAPKTIWNLSTHDAGTFGTNVVNDIISSRNFTFPKSLYAVHDCIRFYTANKPDALIVDFFAGSGTTLHAVNLLNAEDGGHRRCIMVTNNEVSDAEAKVLTNNGYHPGDEEWEKLGIARYVTWPRTVCSIRGHNVDGNPLKGNYIGLDGQKVSGQPMSDGFKANCIYFKLGFLDKNTVALGRQFCELVPILWMKAGAIGPCPELDPKTVPSMLIRPGNHFAILVRTSHFADFKEKLAEHPEINTVFIVTDSHEEYRAITCNLNVPHIYQLYRDYLDNFKINGRIDEE